MKDKAIDVIRMVMAAAGIYGAAMIIMFMLCAFGVESIAPLELTGFVVDKDSEIIIYSGLNSSFYIYSPDKKLRKVITRPEAKGTPVLAIDEDNNIYWKNGGYVFRYGLDGKEELAASVDYPTPSNWRLERDGKLRHFDKPEPDERVSGPFVLRRIAMPGDILFMDEMEDKQPGHDGPAISFGEDYLTDFVDNDGNRYESSGWFEGIRVYNNKNELVSRLRPPFYIWPFIFPLPAGVLLPLAMFAGIVLIGVERGMVKKRKGKPSGGV